MTSAALTPGFLGGPSLLHVPCPLCTAAHSNACDLHRPAPRPPCGGRMPCTASTLTTGICTSPPPTYFPAISVPAMPSVAELVDVADGRAGRGTSAPFDAFTGSSQRCCFQVVCVIRHINTGRYVDILSTATPSPPSPLPPRPSSESPSADRQQQPGDATRSSRRGGLQISPPPQPRPHESLASE